MTARPGRSLEDIVGTILLVGVVASAAVIAVGLTLLVPPGTGKRVLLAQLMSEHQVFLADLPRSLVAVVAGVFHGRPVAIIFMGLLLLILTPVLRVVGVGVYFARHGERRYAFISALILALLLLGFVLGAAASPAHTVPTRYPPASARWHTGGGKGGWEWVTARRSRCLP